MPLIIRDLILVPQKEWLIGRFGDGIAFWQIQDGALLNVFEMENSFHQVAVSRDGVYLATSGTDTFLWQITEQRELSSLLDGWLGGISVTFSPDGQLLVTGEDGYFADTLWSGALYFSSVTSQEQLFRLTPVTRDATAETSSPDGRFLLSGSIDGVVGVGGVP